MGEGFLFFLLSFSVLHFYLVWITDGNTLSSSAFRLRTLVYLLHIAKNMPSEIKK
jgi:hypothetical protein